METMETILTRRSTRRFKDEPVDSEIITTILQAAMSAPSAHNEQPWHFLVIDDKKIQKAIAATHPYAKMCEEAAVTIIPCVDLGLVTSEDFIQQDMAAATQNLLLAIRDMGLGAVWCGVYPKKALVKTIGDLFKLPKEIKPFCIIPLGHTDVPQIKDDTRYQEQRVHYNNW